MNRTPKPMERYRHFKGGCYQILTLAVKEDTGEELVIYQALYGEGKVYARNLENFLSEVDHEKYPDAKQKYRFELLTPEDLAKNGPEEEMPAGPEAPPLQEKEPEPDHPGYTEKTGSLPENPGASAPEQNDAGTEPEKMPAREETVEPQEPDGEAALDPYLERFLDARTTEERLTALDEMRGHVTDEMIDTMALASGVEVGPGATSMRYEDLRDCLATIEKYELERGRLRG